MTVSEVLTTHEFIERFYGGSNNQIAKTDDPVLTSTTGVFNATYGAMAFYQLNSEANAFAILPKYPWNTSGVRVITADPTGGGGQSEGAALPDTDKPTFATFTITAKEVVHTFDVSSKHEALAGRGDDTIANMEFMRKYMAGYHVKAINSMLLTDADTLAGTSFESIDRVTATAAYATALSLDAGDEDIYGLDRTSATWADAGVCDHNSGTDRFFELSMVRENLATLEANGGRTNVILTGSDTRSAIIGQAETQVQYKMQVEQDVLYKVGLNGVETQEGIGIGLRVATVYGIPLFVSQHVPKDTLSRIYLLDTTENEEGVPRLGFRMLSPTMYYEGGMNNGDPFAINKLATEGMYYTAGELVCTFFKAQGSIRDLK